MLPSEDFYVDTVLSLIAAGDFPAAAVAAREHGLAPPDRPLPWAAGELALALEALAGGRYETGLARGTAALAVLEPSRHAAQLPCAVSELGFALGKQGDPQAGLSWAARAAALARQHGRQGQDMGYIKMLSNEGCLHGMSHHYSRAVTILSKASRLAQKLAPRHIQSTCLNNLAYAWLARAGGMEIAEGPAVQIRAAAQRADVLAGRALAAATLAQDIGSQAWARATQARAWVLQGRLDEAEPHLQQALSQSSQHLQSKVEIHRGLMDLYRRRGNWQAARAQRAAALALCDAEGYGPLQLVLFQDAFVMETEAGEPVAALGWWLKDFQGQQALRSQGPADGAAVPAVDADTGLLSYGALEAVAQSEFEQGHGLAVALLRADGLPESARPPLAAARALAVAWQTGYLAAQGVDGGFVLLFAEQHAARALALCETLRQRVAQAWAEPLPPGVAPSLSLGLAWREADADLPGLIGRARQALQSAQAQGGNRVQTARP